MRCDQCRHWQVKEANHEWEASQAGFGECLAVRERWVIMDEAGRDLANRFIRDEKGNLDLSPEYTAVRIAALKAARAYVQDGSEYRAELFTAPDFFCALFEESGRNE